MILLLALGCRPPAEPTTPSTTPTGTPTPGDDDDDSSTTPTADTGTPTPTGETGTPADPCDLISPQPLSGTEHGWISGSEELVFDALGNMYNLADAEQALMRTPYGGPPVPVVPYPGFDLAGIRFLLDGDLAIADEFAGAVMRQSLSGSRTVLQGGLVSPNSLAVGPDGRLYIATYGAILRMDPSGSGPPESLYVRANTDFDGLTFSPTYDRLYFNHDDGGIVGRLVLDPVTFELLAIENHADLGGGWGAELDGMATDACGNVYVARTDGTIERIRPDGSHGVYYSLPGNAWTTALSFGSGVGGWERDHLYVMDRGGSLFDLEVGVDGRPEPHLP